MEYSRALHPNFREIVMRITVSILKTTLVPVCVLMSVTIGGVAYACEPVQIGDMTDDPEKGTVGRSCVSSDIEHTASLSPSRVFYQLPVHSFGTEFGNPEKDTFAYAPLVGEQPGVSETQ
jgi:hypothetical protein